MNKLLLAITVASLASFTCVEAGAQECTGS